MASMTEETAKVLLCLDGSRKNAAEMLGLGAEQCTVPWIREVLSASQAREILAGESGISEVWVAGSGDMDPLNLAAGLQKWHEGLRVFLLSSESTGSFLSRCAAAGVVPCVGKTAACNLYKRAMSVYGGLGKSADDELPLAACSLDRQLSRGGDGSNARKSPHQGHEPPALGTEKSYRTPIGQPCASSYSGIEVSPKEGTPRSFATSPMPLTPEGFVLSVVSGSGGSGKSSVSVLVGVLSQSLGARTVVIDADFQFGDVAWLMGRKDSIDALSLLRHGSIVSDLSPDGNLPAVVRPPDGLECSEEVFGNVSELVGLARRAFDVVIVNTGSFWMDAHLDLIEASNHVLFLCDQRPSSLRGCSRAIDLCIRCGVPTQRFSYALNRCGKQGLLSPMDASCALKGAKVRGLRDGGKEVAELLGAGLPLELAYSKNPFVQDLSKFVDEVLPIQKKSSEMQLDAKGRKSKKGLSLVRRGRAA